VNHPRTLTNENKSVGRSVGRSRSIDRAIDRASDRDDDDARRHNAAPHVTGTSDEMISTTMTTNVAARGVALSRAAPKARRTAGVARAGASDRELWFPGAQSPDYLDGSMAGDYGTRAIEFISARPARERDESSVARGVIHRNARARGKIRYAPGGGYGGEE